MNEAEKKNLLRVVFDALPSAVLVVDQDVNVQEYNSAAADLLLTGSESMLKQRAGELFHCVHASESPQGCGRALSCRHCVIRNAVTEAFRGERLVRLRTKIELVRDSGKVVVYALITASPFSFAGTPHALLVIEDMREITELQRLISICAVCHKVRDARESWLQVETYFKNSWDMDFTHGLCPDCLKLEMAKIDAIGSGQQQT